MNNELIEKGLVGKRGQIEKELNRLPREKSREEHRTEVMREVELSRRKIEQYQAKVDWHNENIDRLLESLTAPNNGADRTKLNKLENDLKTMEELVEFMEKTQAAIDNADDDTRPVYESHMKDLEKKFRSAKGPKI